jgi:uncharacterized protein YigA (DUF484 family)
LRVAASDVQLWECTIFFVDDEDHLLFRAQLPLSLGGSVDLHNCHLRRRRNSCAVMFYRVALFVHKCKKIADVVAVAAVRQQS